MSKNQYYCYALLDPRKPSKTKFRYDSKTHFTHEPFYVGLGQGSRSEIHVRAAQRRIEILLCTRIISAIRYEKY
jgi:hypothetical protein